MAVAEAFKRLGVHEHDHLAHALGAQLEAERRTGGVVVVDRPVVDQQGAFAVLAADTDAGFVYMREDQNAFGIGGKVTGGRRGFVQGTQGFLYASIQFIAAGVDGPGGQSEQQGKGNGEYAHGSDLSSGVGRSA